MVTEEASYEVDWQLEAAPGHYAKASGTIAAYEPAGPVAVSHRDRDLSRERARQVARFGALLAKADAAAVVTCRGQALVIEETDGLVLGPNAQLTLHPSSGGTSKGAIALLLNGTLRWCRTIPPAGFKYASLVCTPLLSSSGRLLLLANRDRHLTEHDLRLVFDYLAELRISPGTESSSESTATTQLRARTRTLLL